MRRAVREGQGERQSDRALLAAPPQNALFPPPRPRTFHVPFDALGDVYKMAATPASTMHNFDNPVDAF